MNLLNTLAVRKSADLRRRCAEHSSAIVTEYDATANAIFGNAVTDVLVNGKSPEDAYKGALMEILSLVD